MTKKYIAHVLRKADFCKALQYFAGTVAIASAFAVLLLVRTEEGFNAYMGCLIPFLVAFAVYYLYAALIRANMIMVFAVSYITVCSLTLMSVIAPSSLSKYIFAMYAAIAIYAVIKLIVTKVRRKKLLLWLVIAMNVLIYAVLLIQPPSEELDYTRAWLVIGGMTFQLTELIKILAVCFLALLYTANLSNKQRLVFLDVFLCINIGGSFLIAEFGSLLALLIVLFSGVFVFENNKKVLLFFFLTLFLIALAGIVVLLLLNSNSGTTGESVIQYVVNRLITRFTGGDGYQIGQAMKAISHGSAFGNFDMVDIPAHSNDFAFASLVQCLGACIAVSFLIAFVALAYLTYRCVPVDNTTGDFDGKASVVSVLFITFQSAIIILVNLGLFPITGINCFFLSSGGASQLVSFTLAVFAFCGSGRISEYISERKEDFSNEAVRKV